MPLLKIGTEQLVELVQQLEPEERLQLLFQLAQQAHERVEKHRAFAEERLRSLASQRGLDWDTMSEAMREQFVDELLHE